MFNKRLSLVAAGSLLTVLASIAQAEDIKLASVTGAQSVGTPVSEAVATQGNVPGTLDHFHLSLFSTFHGPNVNSITNSHTVDRVGVTNSRNAINFDSEVTAAYMFTHTIGAGLTVPFLLVPVLGQGVILGDVGFKAFDRKTISYTGFDLYTNIIVQGPSSTASRERDLKLGLKFTPYVRYSIPRSRFTIGAWTEEKAYLGVSSGKTFKLWSAPYVNYRLTSNFSLNLQYEIEANHYLGDEGMLNFSMYQQDLQPGFVWMITPRVMLNPYLQIFTTNTVTADHMALGATFSATVL